MGVRVGAETVYIRDQKPLYEGNLFLPVEWTFADLIEFLNQRVFFWAGNDGGPVEAGLSHHRRYHGERPAIIRTRFLSICTINPELAPLFSACNSGAPRCHGGRRQPRGPGTFLPASEFLRRPSDVVEVTFEAPVLLPYDTDVADSVAGQWRTLLG